MVEGLVERVAGLVVEMVEVITVFPSTSTVRSGGNSGGDSVVSLFEKWALGSGVGGNVSRIVFDADERCTSWVGVAGIRVRLSAGGGVRSDD